MKKTKIEGYGIGDSSFQAAGGESGITHLVSEFYKIMSTNDEYQSIFKMHARETPEAIDRLVKFLCGWMGGPKLYRMHYGAISIPQVHAHLPIQENERDLWLSCMKQALNHQPYDEKFKLYLLEQFAIPAEMIRKRCHGC